MVEKNYEFRRRLEQIHIPDRRDPNVALKSVLPLLNLRLQTLHKSCPRPPVLS